MKRTAIFLAALLPLASCTPRVNTPAPAAIPGIAAGAELEANTVTTLYSENGFRGIPFGSSLSSTRKQFSYVSHKGKWQYFTRPSDTMTMGKAELMAIYYSFYRSRFSQVTAMAKGRANTDALLAWMQERYGDGETKRLRGGRHVWTMSQVTATYEVNPSTGVAIVTIFNRELLPAQYK